MREGNCQGVDRISVLPDALLSHILSFVSTKTAFKTCILSKRWQQVWTLVPVLDFTEVPSEYDEEELTPEQILLYKSFVDKVLFHNNVTSIRHLRFELFEGCDKVYFESWISAFMRRQISDMSLKSFADRLLLPDELFVSESLRVMKLSECSINVPMSLHLPLLETLHLDLIGFKGDDFIQKLSSGCPALKELSIMCCSGMPRLSVLSSTLEKLIVFHCVDINTSFRQRYLLIDAPKLKYLNLQNMMLQCDIVSSTSLVMANIKLVTEEDYVYDMSWVVKLLKGLSSVQALWFNVYGTRQIDASELPTFHNLTRLKSLADECMFPVLERAPQLESLTLLLSEHLHLGSLPPKTIPKCFSCIVRIEVLGFEYSLYNVNVVACLLKAASALKKIKVHMHRSNKDSETVLSMLPKASGDCQVELCTSRGHECSWEALHFQH